MDCEWNFKFQTLKHYFADSNNENEFLCRSRIMRTENKGTTSHFYKTNKNIDLQKKRINRKVK